MHEIASIFLVAKMKLDNNENSKIILKTIVKICLVNIYTSRACLKFTSRRLIGVKLKKLIRIGLRVRKVNIVFLTISR